MTDTKPLPLPFLSNGVGQVALVVKDLDETVKRYNDVFGIGPWHFYTYEKPLVKKMSYNGEPADYGMRIALSYFGTSRVELIEVKHGPSVYQDFVDKHGYGIQHLGFRVEDMQSAIRQAEEAGYRMIQDGSGFGPDGDGHYAYLDTEEDFGFVIELIQAPKRRFPPEKVYPPEAE
jgi:catechol 2,3-dioxygenase-like lactoylglutathione lyase family enzyme